jgi:hypothetical protein
MCEMAHDRSCNPFYNVWGGGKSYILMHGQRIWPKFPIFRKSHLTMGMCVCKAYTTFYKIMYFFI